MKRLCHSSFQWVRYSLTKEMTEKRGQCSDMGRDSVLHPLDYSESEVVIIIIELNKKKKIKST